MQSHSRWLRRPAESAGQSATEGAQCNTHITKFCSFTKNLSFHTVSLVLFMQWQQTEVSNPAVGKLRHRRTKIPSYWHSNSDRALSCLSTGLGCTNWIDSRGSSARAWDKHCVLCTPGSKLLPGTHCGAPSQAPCLAPLGTWSPCPSD